MRAVILTPLLMLLAACVGSYSRAVEETRLGLMGLSGRELRQCLGAPLEVDLRDGVERQTYRFEREREPWQMSTSSGGLPGPVVDTRGASSGVGSAHEESPNGFCQLDFELREGGVTQVFARGRDAQGMNAAGACLLEARHCIPYEDEPTE